jgi:hypothetical protein
MRMTKLVALLLAGAGAGVAAVAIGKRRTRRARGAAGADPRLQPDPRDPVQGFDDVHAFHVEELGVDAFDEADITAARDLETLDANVELDELTTRGGPIAPDVPPSASPVEPSARPSEIARARRGSGELYGVHLPPAGDTDIPDGDRSFDQGENWIEALQEHATELGPEVEVEVTILDEDDLDSPPTDTRDIPVADRGSAGPRGL